MVVYYLRFFINYSIQLHRQSKQYIKKTKKILIQKVLHNREHEDSS